MVSITASPVVFADNIIAARAAVAAMQSDVETTAAAVCRECCPNCRKPFGVGTTRIDAPLRVRYLVCRACHTRGSEPELVSLELAPRQSHRGWPTGVPRSLSRVPCPVSGEQ